MDSGHDSEQAGPPFLGDRPMQRAVQRSRRSFWMLASGLAAAGAWLALSGVSVGAGQAVLLSDFGSPRRVLSRPGFYLNWPPPIGATQIVDTRLHTSLGTLRDVISRDGQHLRVQAFAAWRVPAEQDAVRTFVRSTGVDVQAASRDIADILDAAIAAAASGFTVGDLLNADSGKSRLADLAAALKEAVAQPVHDAFGVTLLHTGIVQLTLSEASLAATLARMRALREAQAAERTASAQVQAAEIRAEAARDSRIAVAEAETQAAQIEASSRKEAADIEAKAYSADPDLYLMLRSLDTLSSMVGPGTRLVLRTDAAPFSMLVQGPPTEAMSK